MDTHTMIDKFKEFLEKEGAEPETVRLYSYVLSRALRDHKNDLVEILEDKNLSPNSRKVYRAALRAWALWRNDTKMLSLLIARRMKKLSVHRTDTVTSKTKELTQAEVERVLQALRSPSRAVWERPVLGLMIKLALRAKVDLTWITRKSVENALRNEQVLTIVSKGRRVRDVPIAHALEELMMLRQIPRWQTIADLVSPKASPETRHQAAYEAIRLALKRVATEIGLDPKRVRTHAFRHAAANWLLQASGDLTLVQKFLGHQNLRTTEIYVRGERIQELGEILKYRDKALRQQAKEQGSM